MRMSDKLRHIVKYWDGGDCKVDLTHKDEVTLEQVADLLDVYYIQCTAAMKAQSLGLCKICIKYALEEDV